MNGFAEYLGRSESDDDPRDILIYRAGPEAIKWGDPYEYACVVVLHLETKDAEVKALVADGNLSLKYVKQLFKFLHGIGYTPYWERIKNEIRTEYRETNS